MIHYWVELAAWIGGMFLIGCPLGAAARSLLERDRGGSGSGLSGGA